VYNDATKTRVSDSQLNISCSCSVNVSCKVGEFIKNGSSLFNGVFMMSSNTLFNNRPVYTHEAGSLVMYYQMSLVTQCQYWIVAPAIDDSHAQVYAYSQQMSPDRVEMWKQNSRDDADIKFICYDSTSSVVS